MRESKFIEQNKKKWARFEQILKLKKKDPDQLSELFVQITEDLSYSRTFYPNRSVRVYLNSLAQQVFSSIYKNTKPKFQRLLFFWKEELPQVNYLERRAFLISFLIFAFFAIAGAVSSHFDPNFPRVILGDGYVDMTLENIEKGDPMAVYKDGDSSYDFLRIAFNNLRVAFGAFALGALFIVGTVYILLYNGIMVGAFQYFFYQHDVLQESVLAIWIHGTLEISAIIIGGAAGITMGKGLVFPGSYSRLQSFLLSAKRGIKIMLGIAPIIAFAAFLESFVTRYTDVADIFQVGIIVFSLLFILGYFGLYPRLLNRRGWSKPLKDNRVQPDRKTVINYQRMRGNGEIFTEAFALYKKYIGRLFRTSFFASLLFIGLFWTFLYDFIEGYFYLESGWFAIFPNLAGFFGEMNGWAYLLVSLPGFWLICNLTQYLLVTDADQPAKKAGNSWNSLWQFTRTAFIPVTLSLITLLALLLIPFNNALVVALVWIAYLFLQSFCAMWLHLSLKEKVGAFAGLGKTISLLSGYWFRLFGLSIMITAFSALLMFLVNSPLSYLYFGILNDNLVFEDALVDKILTTAFAFSWVFVLHLAIPLLLIGNSLLYYSIREMKEAVTLKQRITQIGKKKSQFGIDLVE